MENETEAVRAEPVAWQGLWDSQWVNIVNHDNAYSDWSKEEAVNHAVKMTEEALHKNNAALIYRLTGEVEKERERAEKFRWQVRDTCARAEAAERRVADLVRAARDLRNRYCSLFDIYQRPTYHASSNPDDDLRLALMTIDAALTQPEADHETR